MYADLILVANHINSHCNYAGQRTATLGELNTLKPLQPLQTLPYLPARDFGAGGKKRESKKGEGGWGEEEEEEEGGVLRGMLGESGQGRRGISER